MAKDTEKLIRQLSLISYLMAERRPVTAPEIRRDVEGYSVMNEDAFARRFYADRSELEALGIVLSVPFLLAALSSLHLSGTITKNGLRANQAKVIRIQKGQTVAPLPKPGQRTIGRGVQTGVVYRLTNGQLVYVQSPPK